MQDFESSGRLWWRNAISDEDVAELLSLAKADARPGARVPPEDPLFAKVRALPVTARIARHWRGMRPVRLVRFDKSGSANWGVPWHQDRVISVQGRQEVPGFTNWSCKNGVWHCAPPLEVLQDMLFVRLHLEQSTPENGAMEIALGSAPLGAIQERDVADVVKRLPIETTTADAGDVLILDMLTVHRSRPARRATGRAVLRVDYAARDLPSPLAWAG